jgi:S1-C subfamily serine protease
LSFFGTYQPPAHGSGVIIDPRGYVITSNHVVKGAQELYVVLADGRQQRANLARQRYTDGGGDAGRIAAIAYGLQDALPRSLGVNPIVIALSAARQPVIRKLDYNHN